MNFVVCFVAFIGNLALTLSAVALETIIAAYVNTVEACVDEWREFKLDLKNET